MYSSPPNHRTSVGRRFRIVVTAGSDLVGDTVESSRFLDQYQAAVLAIRCGGETAYERLTEYRIRPGDLLLIESEPDTVDRLADDPNVIFLLAGVIPLGKALSETGGADLLSTLVVSTGDFLPAIAVLGLFYLLTAAMTNLISNEASVVLLIPVAVDAAAQLNANAFAFVLAVTFAASTALCRRSGIRPTSSSMILVDRVQRLRSRRRPGSGDPGRCNNPRDRHVLGIVNLLGIPDFPIRCHCS
jgi:di/tricarboxylate transporter